MTVCTDQPPQGFIGTFLIGTRTIGARYQDATCGVPTCGYAITGMWWAYLCPTGLALGSTRPSVVAGVPFIDAAGLQLGSRVPGLLISQTVVVAPARLSLGAYIPIFAGQQWLFKADCEDLTLAPATTGVLALNAASVTTIDLEPEVCR